MVWTCAWRGGVVERLSCQAGGKEEEKVDMQRAGV